MKGKLEFFSRSFFSRRSAPPETGFSSYRDQTHDLNGRGLVRRSLIGLGAVLNEEQDRFFLWIPVFMAVGTGLYFQLSFEPHILQLTAFFIIALIARIFLRGNLATHFLSLALICIALGMLNSQWRNARVEAPVIEKKSRAIAVSGWIERIQPLSQRTQRLTLRIIQIGDMKRAELPYRIRLRVNIAQKRSKTISKAQTHPPSQDYRFAIGQAVYTRAILYPPSDPVIPGGFDFARKLWFERIGGSGFSVEGLRKIEPDVPRPLMISLAQKFEGLRFAILKRIASVLPHEQSAFAIALLLGERGLIKRDVLASVRNAGLAHLLAISGLHMGMVAGVLYGLIRALLALFPGIALRFAIKKIAAGGALLGGLFYLFLSGSGIATERAFIMLAIMCIAIFLDRPALSLRNVALAALVIIIPKPETILDVGFQMSFAAVCAMVAAYEGRNFITKQMWTGAEGSDHLFARLKRVMQRYFWGITTTTLIATIAVAPFGLYHFHTMTQYGVIANLIAIPVVGFWVIPMGLIALVTMPLGLDIYSLQAMAWGIDVVVKIADMVAHWPGAVLYIPQIPQSAFLTLIAGGLWLCLWRTRWRLLGLAIICCGVLLANTLKRPDILIARDGKTVAIRLPNGMLSALANAKRRYSFQRWLVNDGDGRRAQEAAQGKGFYCDELACRARVKGRHIAYIFHPAALREECVRADIIISLLPLYNLCGQHKPVTAIKSQKQFERQRQGIKGASARAENGDEKRADAPRQSQIIIDRRDLARNGAYQILLSTQGSRPEVENVAERRGQRPWTQARSARSRQ